jgi:hypothetical protein
MDSIILDRLPFELDAAKLMRALHVREGSSNAAEVGRLVAEAQAIGRPRALYKIAFVEARGDDYIIADGLKFTSRVLRVNLNGLRRFFAYICTAGAELQAWMEAQDDLLLRYWADAINQAVLYAAFGPFEEHLRAAFALGQTARMNPGSLADWPLREQRGLFALLGDPEATIGVRLTDSLLMVPTKSVSGILFPSEETFASCQLCPRQVCPNRRATYDPGLLERKYRAN